MAWKQESIHVVLASGVLAAAIALGRKLHVLRGARRRDFWSVCAGCGSSGLLGFAAGTVGGGLLAEALESRPIMASAMGALLGASADLLARRETLRMASLALSFISRTSASASQLMDSNDDESNDSTKPSD